jgi:hypothetical protein
MIVIPLFVSVNGLQALVADNHSFAYGVVAGVLFMFVVGFFARQVRINNVIAQKPGKKMTVPVQGSDSPRDIVAKGARAGACVTFSVLVMVVFFVALVGFLVWLWQY